MDYINQLHYADYYHLIGIITTKSFGCCSWAAVTIGIATGKIASMGIHFGIGAATTNATAGITFVVVAVAVVAACSRAVGSGTDRTIGSGSSKAVAAIAWALVNLVNSQVFASMDCCYCYSTEGTCSPSYCLGNFRCSSSCHIDCSFGFLKALEFHTCCLMVVWPVADCNWEGLLVWWEASSMDIVAAIHSSVGSTTTISVEVVIVVIVVIIVSTAGLSGFEVVLKQVR